MAEAIVYLVLEQLASITIEQMKEQLRLVVDVDREVKNLILQYSGVQAALKAAEKRQVKEPDVKNWLLNLEDVSYQINDVLDEWNSEILKHKIEKEDKQAEIGVPRPTERKVCFFIPSPSCCFGQIGHVIMRRDIAKNIKEINQKLTSIAKLKDYRFENTIINTEQVLEPNDQTSYANVSSIIGRTKEKEALISLLRSESSQAAKGPLVISIVGMGGLGKTAFAQLVYDDDDVKNNFETRIWVCVSKPFKGIKIAKGIVEVLKKDDDRINSTTLQPLLECIEKFIKDKKFLLVLDDVWNPIDSHQWEALQRVLQVSDKGSRILVTTRTEIDAISMGATIDRMISLNTLSELDCIKLFNQVAFFQREKDAQLEEIGKEIAKKCKGLPLAAKALGSMMRSKNTRTDWLEVLHSDVWKLEEKEIREVLFNSLLLSYNDLTSTVRRCLLYCALFSKDYEFDTDNLIEFWMSQEFLTTEGNKGNERRVGQNCFNSLVMRSFFQDFVKDDNNIIIQCKMHDIVHDFVRFQAKNECYFMEAESADERNTVPDNKVLHLNFMSASNGSFPDSIYNCKRLRTLLASNSVTYPLSSDFFVKLKCLRTLDLSFNSMPELPKDIEALIHLRYLDLSESSSLKELPDTLGNLCNLQTLRLTSCKALEKLPVTITKLVNLKHLHVENCDSLNLPKEIGRLRSLQTLDGLTVNNGDDDKGFQLGDLRNLDQLQGSLWISDLWSVRDRSDGKNAQMENKKNLLHLILDFDCGWAGADEQDRRDEEILNDFQPPPNLEYFRINDYRGSTLRFSWIVSLRNLKRLEFGTLPYCRFLAPLGKLPFLEYFEIEWMSSLKKLGAVEFLGIDYELETQEIFPNLKQLKFKYMGIWEEWEGVEEGHWREADSKLTIMPALSYLEIQYCPQLKTLPDFLWKTPLKTLSITNDSILAEGCKTGTGDAWEMVRRIPNIKLEGKYVQKDRVRTPVS